MGRKKPQMEIIRAAPQSLVPAPQPSSAQLEALLDRLVQERVAEALAKAEDSAFQPYFRSRPVADEIRRHRSTFETRKWALHFEKYGCLSCGRKKLLHCGNGYCDNCRHKIVARLKTIEKRLAREYAEFTGIDPTEQIVSRVRTAERLLGKGDKP